MIKAKGWHNRNKPDAEKTTRFAEYKNTGPGASATQRISWSLELTDKKVMLYTRRNVLGDWVSKYKLTNQK